MPPTPRALTVLLLVALALCASAPAAVAAPEPTVTRDLPYGATGNPALTLDAWSSAPPGSARPVMVLVHGGGWQSGRRQQWEWHDWTAPFARAGFLVLVPSYRLSCREGDDLRDVGDPALCDATMDDATSDVLDVVAWARANAAAYGGDPTRVILVGASAGAQLALLAGSDPRARGAVRGVVAMSPPTNLAAIGARHGHLERAIERSLGCGWVACPQAWTDHSPSTALATRRSAVPTYLYASRHDFRVGFADALHLQRELRAQGTDAVLHQPSIAASGCHGPWACDRFRVAGTTHSLKADVLAWMRIELRPRAVRRPAIAASGG